MERTADRRTLNFGDDFYHFTPSDARARPPSLILFSLGASLRFMIRGSLILLLSAVAVCAQNSPKLAIQTAEEAVVRFREARETDLKTALTEADRKFVAATLSKAELSAYRMQPRDFKPPYNPSIRVIDDPSPIFGSFAAAAGNKNDTWRLYYSTGLDSDLAIYLDALTGKILYIYSIPEG